MSVKRRKVFDGVFTRVEITVTGEDKGDFEEICKLLDKGAPEARIQSHETFTNTTDATDPYVALRIDRLRGLVAQAKNIIVKGEDRRTALALLDNADTLRREILALQYTRSGIKFAASKRGRNRLYREAVAIRAGNKGLAPKLVLHALEAAGVVYDVVLNAKGGLVLQWIDDKRRKKSTPFEQFSERLDVITKAIQ